MIITNEKERVGVIESGRRLGVVLEEVAKIVAPGVTTLELDTLAEKLIRDGGDLPAFKGYTPDRATRPYPATLCISINDEVVHGIPNEAPKVLKEGDIVSLDLGLIHEGFITDSAVTVGVGRVDAKAQKLMDTTQAALEAAIFSAVAGNRVGDISYATEQAFKGTDFSVVKLLGGHGVGNHVHEEPWIANAGRKGTGPELKKGMVLALEPIANEGKGGITLASDGYTYRSKDGSRSAHFEHTIIVEDGEALVITRRPSERIG
jgi:methionyl aminopeptidase